MKSSNIKEGTVVIARMPLREEILNQIEESHQIRPFIVFMMDDFKYYAFSMTTKRKEDRDTCLYLNNGHIPTQGIKEDGTILINKIWLLDESNILSVVGDINNHEYNELIKFVISKKNKLKWHNSAIILYESKYSKIEPKYSEGDIVYSQDDNNYYLIYGICGNILTVCKVFNSSEDVRESFLINDDYYFVDYTSHYFIDLNKNKLSYKCSALTHDFIKIKEYIKTKKSEMMKKRQQQEKLTNNCNAKNSTLPHLKRGMKIYYRGQEYIILSINKKCAYIINFETYREKTVIERLAPKSEYKIIGRISHFKLLEIDLFIDRKKNNLQIKKTKTFI